MAVFEYEVSRSGQMMGFLGIVLASTAGSLWLVETLCESCGEIVCGVKDRFRNCINDESLP